jgi:fumarylacetoacetate (FAA) hydrolase
MKLASLKSKTSRDGELCVVNQSLTHAVKAADIAPTLQYALDHWQKLKPALEKKYQQLNQGACAGVFDFDPKACSAPLPRAYQWADASSFVNHVALVRKSRGAEMPNNFWTDPLMYQGGSDGFLGPCDPIFAQDEAFGIDFEAEVAIITDDVPMAVSKEAAGQHIQLLMLVNDVSLRNLVANELAKGFGFFNAKPASSFSPVAITPDELGSNWDGQRLHLPLITHLNGALFGEPNAGVDMTFSFPQLIAHAAKTRALCAGTIIGSGTVSNTDRTKGSSCIVERRTLEIMDKGQASTSFMRFGDTVRIEMFNPQGQSLFGAIEQTVSPYHPEHA